MVRGLIPGLNPPVIFECRNPREASRPDRGTNGPVPSGLPAQTTRLAGGVKVVLAFVLRRGQALRRIPPIGHRGRAQVATVGMLVVPG